MCSLLHLPSFLERRPDGAIALAGHRISLQLILFHHFAGKDAAMLQQRFTSLTLAEVEQVLAFIDEHRDVMQACFQQRLEIEKQLLDGIDRGPSIAELRASWKARYG